MHQTLRCCCPAGYYHGHPRPLARACVSYTKNTAEGVAPRQGRTHLPKQLNSAQPTCQASPNTPASTDFSVRKACSAKQVLTDRRSQTSASARRVQHATEWLLLSTGSSQSVGSGASRKNKGNKKVSDEVGHECARTCFTLSSLSPHRLETPLFLSLIPRQQALRWGALFRRRCAQQQHAKGRMPMQAKSLATRSER